MSGGRDMLYSYVATEKDHTVAATKRLYKRVCPSVGPSVRPSVGPSVGRSVRNQLFSKSKNEGFSSCISSGKPTNIAEM